MHVFVLQDKVVAIQFCNNTDRYVFFLYVMVPFVLVHWDVPYIFIGFWVFLKGYFTCGKMNVNLKWVIYVEEKSHKMYFWLMWMKDNNSQHALASLP